MVCKKCGADIPEGSTFCTNCGESVNTVTSAQPITAVSPSKVLTFGILGLAFSEFGILGIIFSAIGLKLANRFTSERGSLFGQAKVGRILAKVGLIISIVMTVLLPFIIIGWLAIIGWYADIIKNIAYY